MKHFLFAKLFLLTIFLVNIYENYAYSPPAATVQPLHPTGLRISVPDEHGITLVAFHVKFNEDFDGLEAGHIAKDILKVRNGQWTYQDRHTQLKRDDIIYYWIHVVYQGLGYNLVDQSYRVIDFYNYDGTLYIGDTAQSSQNCTTTSTTWIFENDGRRQACPHQLIFEENFDNFNSAKWNEIKRFAGLPDSEFVVYMTNDVMDTSDGKLRIKPILLETKYGRDFVSRGRLILEDCTGEINTEECSRQAAGSFILPPLISGRINTKGKFEFLFGRVEIRAKLPHGDWIYPLITLESVENTWQLGLHREIRIASSVGNEELRTPEGEIVSGRILTAGGLISSLNESNAHSVNRMNLLKRQSSKPWSDDFHIFEIEWKSGLIVVKVDGVQYGEQTVDGSFGKPSYLTLGVAVGGIHEFQDLVTSSGYVKPWRNVEAKALYKFYRAKDQWYPTWDTKTVLQVDYVKVWAL
ncbi:beta-1,3-glucan-binding protein-like [Monomorium pharaonis]|uniref:beta-1,3-glucan-binding protein n=1 Tax=Monomorium pharaonis TaxID=307658 RepID=UPI00063F47A2|nr:beta-1,3-glucan-binding protein [Monomorium pharaonis]XP_036150943.1 beta-1,3-glucan-binding protein-like [Monomorium pharaonis]